MTSMQPVEHLPTPRITMNRDTGQQSSPHTPSAGVDSALLSMVQMIQHELRTPMHGMLALIDALRVDLRALDAEAPASAVDNLTSDSATPPRQSSRHASLWQKTNDMRSLSVQLQEILDDFRDYATETVEARDAEKCLDIVPDEPTDLGQLLDEVAESVWDDQILSIRAAEGQEARIPPPPELILVIDPSLRGRKSLVSLEAFKKVAYKLINNALRFTNGEGYVEASVAPFRQEDVVDGESKVRHFLRLEVRDTGEGMSEEFISQSLFKPFAKADKYKSGAGLSMAICSSLVRRLGGSMTVSSDKGRGSIIHVLFPVLQEPEDTSSLFEEASSPNECVYFWKFDSIGLQRLAGQIASQLATYGNIYASTDITECSILLLPEEVTYSGKGFAALQEVLDRALDGVKIGVLQAHNDAKIEWLAHKNGSPQPVFVTRKPFGVRSFNGLLKLAGDQVGPPMEQIMTEEQARTLDESDNPMQSHISISSDLARRLSSSTSASIPEVSTNRLPNEGLEEEGKLAPVMDRSGSALSGSTSASSAKRGTLSLDLMFAPQTVDDVLRSTVPQAQMLAPPTVDDVLKTIAASGQGQLKRSPFQVQVVEDNSLNKRILTRVMDQCKVGYLLASDGAEAVEQFRQHRPPLVLLDINMPIMGGYDAALAMRAIEAEDKTVGIRSLIIAVTALSDDYSRRKGLEECDMDQWLTKPIEVGKLRSSLQKWKETYESGLALSQKSQAAA